MNKSNITPMNHPSNIIIIEPETLEKWRNIYPKIWADYASNCLKKKMVHPEGEFLFNLTVYMLCEHNIRLRTQPMAVGAWKVFIITSQGVEYEYSELLEDYPSAAIAGMNFAFRWLSEFGPAELREAQPAAAQSA